MPEAGVRCNDCGALLVPLGDEAEEVACGLVVSAIVFVWRNDLAGAFVIGGSIAVSLVSACVLGLSVPSLLHRFKLDPKIAAGPVTLALADFVALVIYFTSAWLVLR